MGMDPISLGVIAGMAPGLISGASGLVGPLMGGTAAAGAGAGLGGSLLGGGLAGDAAGTAGAGLLGSMGKDMFGGALTGGIKSGLGLLQDSMGPSSAPGIPQLPAPPPLELPQFSPSAMGPQPGMMMPQRPMMAPQASSNPMPEPQSNPFSLRPSGRGARAGFYSRLY